MQSTLLKTTEELLETAAFDAGRQAYHAGKKETDNPHIIGKTKLGNLKLSDEGHDWLAGYTNAKPPRIASKAEVDAAVSVDVRRFRRKSNRYYGR
jgi:hypothetical protein